jgi:GT2 family glycosyltransferase
MKHYGPAELIVIDNGSVDGSYELLLEKYCSVTTIRQIRGGTIGRLRNNGARMGTGRYVSFIDSDCVVSKDYFDRVAELFSSIDADATGCVYDLPRDAHWIERTWQEMHQHRGDGYVRFINSGNFVIKRMAFERSGGFSERLVTGEDAELCLRLTTAGWRIYESHSVSAIHLGNPKSLAAFCRKQSWHGLGMFGSLRHSWLDKPLWMTICFLISSGLGLAALLFGRWGWGTRAAVLVLCLASVPAVTVAYRAFQTRKLPRLPQSVLLYWLYYVARVHALGKIVFRPARLRAAGGTRAL